MMEKLGRRLESYPLKMVIKAASILSAGVPIANK